MKKTNNLQKQLKFHCPTCKNIYQLLEIQAKNNNCADNCLTKWREICYEHYQEKILGYLKQQEEQNEKALVDSVNWPDWLKKQQK